MRVISKGSSISKGSVPGEEEMVFYILSAHCLCSAPRGCFPWAEKSQKRQPHSIRAFSRTHSLANERAVCGFPYTKWFVTSVSYRFIHLKPNAVNSKSWGGGWMLLALFSLVCVVILRLGQRSCQNLIYPPNQWG